MKRRSKGTEQSVPACLFITRRNHAGHHYAPVRRLQEPELFDHEEQEAYDWSLGVPEVLQHLPQAYVAQRNQVNRSRGVSSTVKLPVSKTGLGGSNPSAPASFGQSSRKQ